MNNPNTTKIKGNLPHTKQREKGEGVNEMTYDEQDDDELVTLNITMSRETRDNVMLAVFAYYRDILRAMDEVKHQNEEYDVKLRAKRQRVSKNLLAVIEEQNYYGYCTLSLM